MTHLLTSMAARKTPCSRVLFLAAALAVATAQDSGASTFAAPAGPAILDDEDGFGVTGYSPPKFLA